MKCPLWFGPLAVAVAGYMIMAICPTISEARIGERRESIERRLFSSGGIMYRDDAISESRQKGMPYLKYFEYLSSSTDVRVYFKTADGRNPSSSELEGKGSIAGWDLHIVYVGGQSIIEVYKRSQNMSEDEFNRLLALHAEGSFWKRLSKEEKAELVSAFGVDMIRDDGATRAKKLGGGAVLFVESEVDIKLAELNASALQEKAPVSVEGF